MKKIFSLFAAVLFAGSMMADSYTIAFKDAGEGKGDNSTSMSSTTVSDYIAEGAEYVSAIAASGKVYLGQYGYGLKFGNSSGKGSVTLTLATPVTPTSIVMNASPWSATEGSGILQDSTFATSKTGAKGTFGDFTYVYDGATKVTTIIVGTASKRGYVKSITVNYGGEVPPVEPKEEYYLTGSFRSWAATADANYKFAATATEGEYALEAAFDAAVECKAIGLKEGADTKWYPDGMDNNFALEAGEYTIYLRPAGNAGEGWHEGVLKAEKKTALPAPTNCAEAAQAALSVSANNELYNNGKEYTIEGYVTEIAYAWKDKSMSFWMADTKDGGKVLEAYKCAIEDEADAVRVGDKVKVTGKLTKFNTTPEFATGCTVQMIERAQVVDPVNLGEKTIAEFLELKNTKDTCILSGVVDNITNAAFGNFDLLEIGKPETKVYVYGLLTAAGEAQKFADLDIAAGDTLTIKAIYNEYNNKPQIKNAIFVSVKKSTAPVVDPVNLGKKTIAEFLELKNTKDTCILTGVIDNVVSDEYGNFDLIDETDTVYVYGLLNEAGEAQKCFKDKELAEGDTLTILALYNEFKGAPQVKNAIFVSVAKKAEAKPEVEVEYDEIVFAEAVAANDLAENASFTVEGSQFSATIADADNKMAIDENACRFGTAEDYTTYQFRLKSGGASSSTKNFITLNIPEAGKIRIAPRTGSNSATDRALVIEQGDTLYNEIVQESQAIKVIEGEKEVPVYPYVEVEVAAGSVRVSYTAGMNFYCFGFLADAKPTAVEAIEGQNSKVEIVKVIRDGQLLIICGDKTYNVLGTVIR